MWRKIFEETIASCVLIQVKILGVWAYLMQTNMLGVSYKCLVFEDHLNMKSWYCVSKHRGHEGGVMDSWEQVDVILETIMGPASNWAGCDQKHDAVTLLGKKK